MRSVYTIILNYNNYKDTEECISSLMKCQNSDVYRNQIVLVDNCSSDGSGEQLRQFFGQEIVYLPSDANNGYAAGNNIGIRYAIQQGADYICVLNNDTVADEDFILPCIEYLKNRDNVAFVSPVIVDYFDNKVQSTGGDIIFKKGEVILKNNGKERAELPGEIECDYIGGACMIFKAALVRKIGLIPENYFLFFEETEWCCRAKTCGLHNISLSSTYLKHKGSASIDIINGLHVYLMERNRVVFLKRNAPRKITYVHAVFFLMLKYLKKGLFEDHSYLSYLKYMSDGLTGRVDKAFPFIVVRS